MKLSRWMLGPCVLAAIVLSGALAAGASAAVPELGRCVLVAKGTGEFIGKNCQQHSTETKKGEYNWLPGAEKNKFEGFSLEGVTLEASSNKAHTIKCAAANAYNGEYTGPKTESVTIDIVGCNLPTTHQKCQSSPVPQKEGEIETTVTGELGFIRTGEKPLPGWDLKGWEVTVTCGQLPETNIPVDKITGSVIGGVLKFGKMLKEETVKFKATEGKQIPESFVGEPKDVLSSEWTEGVTTTTEQTGLKANDILTENEELLEIKIK
jgi:hypothetical protein